MDCARNTNDSLNCCIIETINWASNKNLCYWVDTDNYVFKICELETKKSFTNIFYGECYKRFGQTSVSYETFKRNIRNRLLYLESDFCRIFNTPKEKKAYENEQSQKLNLNQDASSSINFNPCNTQIPFIYNLDPSNGPIEGGGFIHITGANFFSKYIL